MTNQVRMESKIQNRIQRRSIFEDYSIRSPEFTRSYCNLWDMSDTIETEVLHINPNDIIPNSENPRMIFYPEDLEILKRSIRKNGILWIWFWGSGNYM